VKRIRAIKAIKQNYRWRGVWVVLRAPVPEYVRLNFVDFPLSPGARTWLIVILFPDVVIGWQGALAEGVFV
jgi:hypothetical protein